MQVFFDGLLGYLEERRNGLSRLEQVGLIVRVGESVVLSPSLERSIPLLGQQKPSQLSLHLLADELRAVQHSLYYLFLLHII